MIQHTPLYQWHQANNGRIVDFAGWGMAVNYGSQIEEHLAVRQSAGMFDVSHMTVVDVRGADAKVYLQYLLANDVARIDDLIGKALYSGMLNPSGGVIDDLIVYNMGVDEAGHQCYRMVVNCATREKDIAWMQSQIGRYVVQITTRDDLAMIAVQGPQAIKRCQQVVSAELSALINTLSTFQGGEYQGSFYARTGYTGEDGLEIIIPAREVQALWESLLEVGVVACGLGARDTLRLEAGMNLYGNEMDDAVSPLVANMGWTIAWQPEDRVFIGREAISAERDRGVTHQLFGLVMRDKGVLRPHQQVIVIAADGSEQTGDITSGTFSPTLGYSIALARMPTSVLVGQACLVEIRNRRVAAEVVKPCFVRNGEVQV